MVPVENEERRRPISVVHVITRLDRGGSAEIVLELVRRCAEDGLEVTLVTGRTDDPAVDPASFSQSSGVRMIEVPSLIRAVSPTRDLAAFIRLRSIIRGLSPDIVHTHTSKAGILGRFAAWSAGVKKIVHTPHGHIFYGYFGTLVTSLFILAERLAATITSRITVLTDKGLRDHIDMRIAPAEKFKVVFSGVDIGRFEKASSEAVRKELGFKTEPVVGWAGRLVPIKDCTTFVRAAALIAGRIDDVRFVVAGDGEERESLQNLAAELGLNESLVFLGNRTDIENVMAAMDVFVLSSRNEGFGRVIVEAMASGAVVVSTDVGGTADIVRHGETGLLVPAGDHDRLSDCVCSLFGDPALRKTLSEAGRKCVRKYDLRLMVALYEELYEELVGDGRRGSGAHARSV